MARLVTLAAIALIACSSSANDDETKTDAGPATPEPKDQTVDAAKECERRLSCKQTTNTREECVLAYNAARVTASCKAKLDTATCADSVEAVDRICFPACTGTVSTCHADGTITTCSDRGYTYTFACEGVCALAKKAWTGACGVPDGGTKVVCGCQ